MNRSDIFIIIEILIVCTLALGIYVTYEYFRRDMYEDNSYICGNFNNITNLTIVKNACLWDWCWHWTYIFTTGYFVQRCPTFQHDISIYNNDSLVIRTDGKLSTSLSKIQIKDCHGDVMYTIKFGDMFQTMINSNKIWTSLIVKNTKDEIFTYATANIFTAGTIVLYDIYGNSIACISEDITTDDWKWTYDIYNKSLIKMEVLIVITAKLLFSPIEENNDQTDICNKFFLGAGITALILLCVLCLVGVFMILTYHKNNKKILS